MFVLDTNVLSELMDPQGAAQVLAWSDPIRKEDLFTTALNQAEIFYGIAIMPEGRKRSKLVAWADAMFTEEFRGRILPFDERAAGHFADIAAKWTKLGRLVASFDPQIAAIARAHDMTVVTRNVRHFEGCEVSIINPWSL
jgi:toxin FitB